MRRPFIEDVFDDILSMAFTPRAEPREDLHYEYGLPGVKKEEITVTTEGRNLTIKVESTKRNTEKTLIVSDLHDLEKTKVKYRDGLLTLDIPLKEEKKPKFRNIQIE